MTDLTIRITATDKASGTVHGLESSFKQAFDGIREDLRALKGAFEGTGKDIVKTFEEVGEDIQESLKGASKEGGFSLGPIAGGMLHGIGKVKGIVTGILGGIVSAVTSAFSAVFDIVTGVFRAAFSAVLTIAKGILSGIGSVISFAFSGLSSILDTVLLGPFRLIFNKITALAGGIGIAFSTKVAAALQEGKTKILALFDPQEVTPVLDRYIRESIQQIRTTTGAPVGALVDVVKNLVSGGIKEGIKEVGEAVTKFAALDDVSMAGESAKLFSRIMRTFRLDAEGLRYALDMVAMSWKKGILEPGDYIMQMGKAIGSTKALYKDWAKGFSEVLGAISLATTAGGLTPEMAFTGVGNILLQLSRPFDMWTKEAQEVVKELGFEVKNAKGEFVGLLDVFEQLGKASEEQLAQMFGQRQIARLVLGIASVSKDYKALVKDIHEAGGTLDASWSQREKSVTVQFNRMIGEFNNIFSTLFSMLETDLGNALKTISEVLGDLRKMLQEFSDDDGWGKIKAWVSDTWEGFLSLLPKIEAGFNTILTVGIAAWQGLSREFNVLKTGMVELFTGGNADFSGSILITGFRIAFEYVKIYAAEAFDYIKESLAGVFDSPIAEAIANKARALWDIIKAESIAGIKRTVVASSIAAKEALVITAEDVQKFLGADEKGGDPLGLIKAISSAVFPEEDAYKKKMEQYKRITSEAFDMEKAPALTAAYAELRAPLPLPSLGFDQKTLYELEGDMMELIEQAQKGAPEKAEKLKSVIKDAIRPVVDAVQKTVSVPEEIAAEVKDDGTKTREKIKEVEKALEETKHEMHLTTVAQSEYVTKFGEVAEELVMNYKNLYALYKSQSQKLKQLQESLP